MSNRIRRMLQQRQQSLMDMAQANRPIDLDQMSESMSDQLQQAIAQDSLSPIPLGADRLARIYAPLIRGPVNGQALDQYIEEQRRTLQDQLEEGEAYSQPMINSVMQLDR